MATKAKTQHTRDNQYADGLVRSLQQLNVEFCPQRMMSANRQNLLDKRLFVSACSLTCCVGHKLIAWCVKLVIC
eukprot:5763171-Pyramimonas_sp.AAC.1